MALKEKQGTWAGKWRLLQQRMQRALAMGQHRQAACIGRLLDEVAEAGTLTPSGAMQWPDGSIAMEG